MGTPPDGRDTSGGEAGWPPDSAETDRGDAGAAPSDELAGMVHGYGQQVRAGGWRNLPAHDDVFSAPEDRVEDTATLVAVDPERNGWLGKKPARWAVVGTSQRGLSHKYEGKFREDSLAVAVVHGWHLAAVADGGGSYALARVGARVAAAAALASMSERASLSISPGVQALASLLQAGLQAGYDALCVEGERRSHTSPKATVKDLRTTLLLVAHRDLGNGEQLIGGAQVGDGIVVARASNEPLGNESPLIWLGRPDTGPSGNEVLFLQDVAPRQWNAPSEDQRSAVPPSRSEETSAAPYAPSGGPRPRAVPSGGKPRIFVKRVHATHVYCLAMTDGVADDFLPNDQNLWRLERTLFLNVVNKPSLQEVSAALEALLDYKRADSFDDRTLACIYQLGDRAWT